VRLGTRHILAEDRYIEEVLELESPQHIVSIPFSHAVADNAHGDPVLSQQLEHGMDPRAWAHDLSDVLSAQPVHRTVNQEARPPAATAARVLRR
jgi:hypothetical protein